MKKLLYILFFGFAFLFSLYWTFPADSLKPVIEEQILEALKSQDPGAHWVHPPRVQIGYLSIWRFSGVSLDDVHLQMGSMDEEPGQVLEVPRLKMRLGLLSSLTGKPKIEFDSGIYGGDISGYVVLNSTGSLDGLRLNISTLDLKKLRGKTSGDDLGMTGLINLDVDLNLGAHPAKDGSGSLNINFKNLSVGPGMLNIPGGMGGMTLPLVRLGQFSGKASFQQGKAKIQDLKLAGGDLEAHINASLELSENILFSPLKGNGWFKMKPEFQQANPKFGMILDMSPEIKAAEDAEGQVHFTLIGSLMQPTPKWGKGD